MGGFRGGYQGECDVLPPPTGINTCSNCGDGYCDTYNGENKCNCSQDCQKEGDNVFVQLMLNFVRMVHMWVKTQIIIVNI